MKRRVLALAALLILLLPAPTSATGSAPTWGYSWSIGFNGWVDSECSRPEPYHNMTVILYAGAHYTGTKTKVCHSEPTLCKVPAKEAPIVWDCGTPWRAYFNDAIDSIAVTWISGGANACVQLTEHINYAGVDRVLTEGQSIAEFTFGAKASSLRRYCW